jgi:hypothetical protein
MQGANAGDENSLAAAADAAGHAASSLALGLRRRVGCAAVALARWCADTPLSEFQLPRYFPTHQTCANCKCWQKAAEKEVDRSSFRVTSLLRFLAQCVSMLLPPTCTCMRAFSGFRVTCLLACEHQFVYL